MCSLCPFYLLSVTNYLILKLLSDLNSQLVMHVVDLLNNDFMLLGHLLSISFSKIRALKSEV